MSNRLDICVRNDLSELERVSRLVDEFGRRNEVPAKTVFEINLALEEILTNVISYGYDDGGEHGIVVRFALAGDEMTLAVEDDGRPFDPLRVPEAEVDKPLEERPIGGLGVHLVRRLADRLEYRWNQGKNQLVFVKKLGR